MSKIQIKSFRGGLSEDEREGIRGAFKFGKNLDIRKSIDSLSCGQALTDDLAAGTMTGITRFIVPASDGLTYFFNYDGKIYSRTSGGTYTLVHTEASESGLINGAYEWYNSAGDTFLYWTTATRLNRKRIIGSGYTNSNWSDANATVNGQTYPKTNLTSATWHTMREVNGVMLGCNENTLFQVGYDDSYTNNALQLIPGNQSKSIFEQYKMAVIGCTRKDAQMKTALFGWGGLSLAYDTRRVIPFASVNSLIQAEVPLMQVGTDGLVFYADVYESNDEPLQPIMKFVNGGQTNPDGVEVDSNVALFGVYGNGTGYSGIYSYGRRLRNKPLVPNLEYQFDCDEIGSVKKIGTTILFSYRSGSNYGVKKVDLSNKAAAVYESLDLSIPSDFAEMPIYTGVKLITKPLPAGTSISVSRKIDKNGDFEACSLEGGGTAYDVEDGTEALFLMQDSAKIIEIQITLTPYGNSTPEVLECEVYFE